MPKFLVRIVAVVLLPCLMADPTLATVREKSFDASCVSSGFLHEALEAPLLNFAPNGFNPSHTAWLFSFAASVTGTAASVLLNDTSLAAWGFVTAMMALVVDQAGRLKAQLAGAPLDDRRVASEPTGSQPSHVMLSKSKDRSSHATSPHQTGTIRTLKHNREDVIRYTPAQGELFIFYEGRSYLNRGLFQAIIFRAAQRVSGQLQIPFTAQLGGPHWADNWGNPPEHIEIYLTLLEPNANLLSIQNAFWHEFEKLMLLAGPFNVAFTRHTNEHCTLEAISPEGQKASRLISLKIMSDEPSLIRHLWNRIKTDYFDVLEKGHFPDPERLLEALYYLFPFRSGSPDTSRQTILDLQRETKNWEDFWRNISIQRIMRRISHNLTRLTIGKTEQLIRDAEARNGRLTFGPPQMIDTPILPESVGREGVPGLAGIDVDSSQPDRLGLLARAGFPIYRALVLHYEKTAHQAHSIPTIHVDQSGWNISDADLDRMFHDQHRVDWPEMLVVGRFYKPHIQEVVNRIIRHIVKHVQYPRVTFHFLIEPMDVLDGFKELLSAAKALPEGAKADALIKGGHFDWLLSLGVEPSVWVDGRLLRMSDGLYRDTLRKLSSITQMPIPVTLHYWTDEPTFLHLRRAA